MKHQTLQAALQQQIVDDADRTFAHSIFSTADVSTISDLLNGYCKEQFGQIVSTCTFVYLSVGATCVVQLADRREIVIKANGPQYDLTALTASCQIQNFLAEQGFPCPRVLRLPEQFGTASLMVQSFCDPGDRVNPVDPNINTTMACYLAKLMRHTKASPQLSLLHSELPVWMELHQPQLWHKPHNVLFNFEKTAAGAEWIDEIAHQSKQILREATGPLLIGHSDWSLQNMSFYQGKLTSVYDWDSLRLGLEPCFVGGAARCFRHDWRYGPPKTAITIEEMLMFVEAYEQERGQPFTPNEHRVLGAAIVYTAAYEMRCVHAIKTPEDAHYTRSRRKLHQLTESFLQ